MTKSEIIIWVGLVTANVSAQFAMERARPWSIVALVIYLSVHLLFFTWITLDLRSALRALRDA